MLEQVLLELALLFALCVGVAVTFHRLRLPPIVGFLFAGVPVRVEAKAACAGKTLAAAAIRRRTGCSVVAVRRDGKNLPVITPETVLEPCDTVVVIGPERRIADAAAMYVPPTAASPLVAPANEES